MNTTTTTTETRSGYFDGLRGYEINLTTQDALSASHVGDCSLSVCRIVELSYVKTQLAAFSDQDLQAALKEAGAWDAGELQDREANERRALWMAACEIRENIAQESR